LILDAVERQPRGDADDHLGEDEACGSDNGERPGAVTKVASSGAGLAYGVR
jgi:hypothetical protein